MYICYRFQVSHQGAWCRCCLRRFGDLRKNTPLDFWSMYPVYFVDVCRFQGPSNHLVVYVPPAGAFIFLKKHAPGILEHVSCEFCQCLPILGPQRGIGTE